MRMNVVMQKTDDSDRAPPRSDPGHLPDFHEVARLRRAVLLVPLKKRFEAVALFTAAVLQRAVTFSREPPVQALLDRRDELLFDLHADGELSTEEDKWRAAFDLLANHYDELALKSGVDTAELEAFRRAHPNERHLNRRREARAISDLGHAGYDHRFIK